MVSEKDEQQQQQAERNAGLILIGAAIAALLVANSALGSVYEAALHWKVGPVFPRFGQLDIHHWIADGLMAIFFLLVGLEVKREWYEGRLSTPAERRLPIVAAASGMLAPALIFLAVTGGDATLARGWAIPAATDIAFAIGVLAILGRRAPPSIKLLLVTIAIVDDIGAVAIIALFYTAELNVYALGGAILVAVALAALGQFGVRRLWPYLAGFAIMWLLMLESGVHATIAGVLTALTVPLGRREPHSPLKRLEHDIHPWVMFGIMPLFGFASAGVELPADPGTIGRPLPLAILLALFLGKQLGVFGAIWASVKTGLAPIPKGADWRHIYGASLLCGIGFTMSLFIAALAFSNPELVDEAKIGILTGSLLSALAGYLVLRVTPPALVSTSDVREAKELFGADQPD